MRKVLVTGGAGFIGSQFLRLLAARAPRPELVCLDALTYAGSRDNLEGLEDALEFVHGDIRDAGCLRGALRGATHVAHFAAETHVDRSIVGAAEFLSTNVQGTETLLRAAREAGVERLVVVGTDEVYGSVAPPREAREEDLLAPGNPYSASKAAADHLALAHHNTYGLPVCVTRCGNNYGPRQFPEKLLPLAILNALRDRPIPVYGDGRQVRDWVHVEDHARAVELVLEAGTPGRIYNVGARGGRENIEVLRTLLARLGKPASLLAAVRDRPGHDRRYAVDPGRLERELGWRPRIAFDAGLAATVDWYRGQERWWRAALERAAAARRHWLEES
ncbi:MAG: dTDP-glucose 4,6-dehydratase [Planctomycetaceae bacterium]